jgi:hypothetical protein
MGVVWACYWAHYIGSGIYRRMRCLAGRPRIACHITFKRSIPMITGAMVRIYVLHFTGYTAV